MNKLILCLSLMLTCIYAQSVRAHELNAAQTSFSYNKRTQSLEIIHSFYLHDVDHFAQQYSSKNPKKNSKDKHSGFSDYIRGNLKMSIDNRLGIETKFVGTEPKVNKFYIYQELNGVSPSDVSKITVDIGSMKNIWKPKYWLFTIDFAKKHPKDFVLDSKLTSSVVSF